MSSGEKVKDPLNGNNASEDDSQGQSETDENSTRSVSENLSSGGEVESGNEGLPSIESVKETCHSSSPSFKAPNVDPYDESTDDYSSQEIWSLLKYPLIENALITPRPNPTATSASAVKVSDVNGSKTVQSNPSPFSASPNADFSSPPPDRGTSPVIKSFSKNLRETNTPSPDKRSADTDVESTPTKRVKITPESDSHEHGVEIESCRPKSNLSTPVARVSYKSPDNLQVQLFKAAIQKSGESKFPNTPFRPNDKRIAGNVSGKSSIEDESNLPPTSQAADIVHESATNQQMHGIDVAVQSDESFADKNPSTSFRDGSLTLNSLAGLCNFDGMFQHEGLLVLPLKEPKSTVSVRQRDRQPAGNVPFGSEQSEFSAKEFELVVHPPKLADETSGSNPEISQNSTAAGFESGNEVKKMQDSVASQTPSYLATEPHDLKSQFIPLISNPHLLSSCHLPRRINSPLTDAPRRMLEFEISNRKMRNDKNLSDASTQTSSPNTELISQLNDIHVSRRRNLLKRSLSDEAIASKYPPKSYRLQAISPRSRLRESSTPHNYQRTSFDQASIPMFHPIVASRSFDQASTQMFQPIVASRSFDQASIPMFQPTVTNGTFHQASTSRNHSGVLGDTNPPPMNLFEEPTSTSRFQPVVTEASSLNQASTSASINRPAIDRDVLDLNQFVPMFERYTIVFGSCSSSDSSSDDSPASSRQAHGVPESPADEFAEYTDEATIILKAILKKMMIHNGDGIIVCRFEWERDNAKLCFILTRHLANRVFKLWSQSLYTPRERTIEARLEEAYEQLFSTVISTLVSILRGTLHRHNRAFFHNYLNFRTLTGNFYSAIESARDRGVIDEETRNRVENLTKMMHRLLLRTSLAFQLILMYLGEKCGEEIQFGGTLREEDTKFLRRTFIY